MKTYYCDMDGVLADFNAEINAVERFRTEKGFFAKLKVFRSNAIAIRKLIADGNNVFILSASPNDAADGDKRKWLAKHFPTIDAEHIIIMRNGQKKVDFMKSADGILFDDYGVNLREWTDGHPNNIGVKIRADGDIRNYLLSLV